MNIEPYLDQIKLALDTSEVRLIKSTSTEVQIESNNIRLLIYFDPRDRILQSLIEPRDVPAEYREQYQTSVLLRMIGFMDDDDELKASRAEELPREIRKVAIVMKEIFLGGIERIRDAYYFCEGYGAGYTDGINVGSDR